MATSVQGLTKARSLSRWRELKAVALYSVDFCVGSRGSCTIEGGFVRWMLLLNEYPF